jgi:hypothetical protein
MPPVRTSPVPLFALFVLLPALASAQTPAPPAMALLPVTLPAQTAGAEADQQHRAALFAFWTARADVERALGEE